MAVEIQEKRLEWHSPKESPFAVYGFAWFLSERIYRRIPKDPPCPVSEGVEYLANNTAGGQIRFRTDSIRLGVRVVLPDSSNMPHMPATGQSGFDCYIGPSGRLKYCCTASPELGKTSYERIFFDLPGSKKNREITLYFPLYQGVNEIFVGLEPGCRVSAPGSFPVKGRVIAYGTSITQGGCACRPGMAYTNILSRKLGVEFINLGFSGNGRGEPEVARIIAGITDPACYILDYEANTGGIESYSRTLPEFIRILRETHASVPILVIPRPPIAVEQFDSAALLSRFERRDFARDLVARLASAGDSAIFFHDCDSLLGRWKYECTVDGGHPTDLGFMLMADSLVPVLKKILTRKA